MAQPTRIDGIDQFYRLSKELKAAGDTGMRKALNREIAKGTKPLVKRTRAVAREVLPKTGGLNKVVAKAPQVVKVKTGRTEKDAGVRIGVRSRSAVRAANKGVIRHPVFARSDRTRKEWTWVEQKVPSGWFDDTLRNEGPAVVEKAVREAVQGVISGVVKAVPTRTRTRSQQGAAGWSLGGTR